MFAISYLENIGGMFQYIKSPTSYSLTKKHKIQAQYQTVKETAELKISHKTTKRCLAYDVMRTSQLTNIIHLLENIPTFGSFLLVH